MYILLFAILFLQIFLMLFIALFGIVMIYFMLSSRFMYDAPPIPSSGKVKNAMIADVAEVLSKRENQVIMDLGSGWGTLLIPLAKKFPNHQFIGIEHNFLPYLISKFRARKLKNILFYRQDLLDTDVSRVDILLVFLLPRMMNKVSVKFQAEAKAGALVYVNRFQMLDMKAEKEVSFGSRFKTYYVYKKLA